ncbi:4-demethylwyosine synthase TYW1 [Candidatus Geothermarchaeota archaeon]|nr:MAG: 4-demethylwyosine synthase TYW1 [Candidatus Geothermarchaeota archaeon]
MTSRGSVLGKEKFEILRQILRKQRYHLIGTHSAVKKCNWLHKALAYNIPCYKQKFYGIKTHRCVQMTPAVIYCTLRCVYCWRLQPEDVNISWNQLRPPKWDDPETIVEGSIHEQRRILSGYKDWVLRGKLDKKTFEEAWNPNQAAISLSGEPTLYPYLSDLIAEYKRRGFTTFLVTNGTIPKALEKLNEKPTQLYITLPAYNKETFLRVNRPLIKDAWQRLLDSLDLMPSMSTRTVIRLTLVKGLNMKEPKKYAKLIERANPMFIEPKGYVHVGFSQKRLSRENMPTHVEIRRFAEELAEELGYYIADESPSSRVVLLSREKKVRKIGQ